MSGVAAGGNILIATHNAKNIEGVYIDRSTNIFVFPTEETDETLLANIQRALNVSGHQVPPEIAHNAELALGLAAARIDQLESEMALLLRHFGLASPTNLNFGHSRLPRDVPGLIRLREQIDFRHTVFDHATPLREPKQQLRLPVSSISAVFYRFHHRAFSVPFPYPHPTRTSSRFSDGTFAMGYAAASPKGALIETHLNLAEQDEVLERYSFNAVIIKLSRALDLTNPEVAEVVEKWMPGAMATLFTRSMKASNQLGREFLEAGVEAVIYPSRMAIGQKNIAIFSDNMLAQSEVTMQPLSGLDFDAEDFPHWT